MSRSFKSGSHALPAKERRSNQVRVASPVVHGVDRVDATGRNVGVVGVIGEPMRRYVHRSERGEAALAEADRREAGELL